MMRLFGSAAQGVKPDNRIRQPRYPDSWFVSVPWFASLIRFMACQWCSDREVQGWTL